MQSMRGTIGGRHWQHRNALGSFWCISILNFKGLVMSILDIWTVKFVLNREIYTKVELFMIFSIFLLGWMGQKTKIELFRSLFFLSYKQIDGRA